MTTVQDRIDIDTTPMSQCDDCGCPLDISGRPTAANYIHMVETERQEAEDITVELLSALEPYAAMANRYPEDAMDAMTVMEYGGKPVVSLGDLRRAKMLVDKYL